MKVQKFSESRMFAIQGAMSVYVCVCVYVYLCASVHVCVCVCLWEPLHRG
jgi:hypothetical protein